MMMMMMMITHSFEVNA